VQLYTALTFAGPGLALRVSDDLAALLARDGFARVADAVGADNPLPPCLTRKPTTAAAQAPGWQLFRK